MERIEVALQSPLGTLVWYWESGVTWSAEKTDLKIFEFQAGQTWSELMLSHLSVDLDS